MCTAFFGDRSMAEKYSPLNSKSGVDAAYYNMRNQGQVWIPQLSDPERPLHIDAWREREHARLDYEFSRQFNLVFGRE